MELPVMSLLSGAQFPVHLGRVPSCCALYPFVEHYLDK